jgi:cell division septation protein DedD
VDGQASGTQGNGLDLRFSSLVGACVLIVVAVALAYLAGVMRGRASLEQQPPHRKSAITEAAPGRGVADGNPLRIQDKILSPEELRFASVLKNRPAPAQLQQPLKPAAPPVEQPADSSRSMPEDKALSPVPQEAMHDYVFQVAVLRDEDGADALRQRLEGHGLRTRMQRSGKNLAILVLLRGNGQRAAEIPRIMEELRLGKPVLRSKKTVTP